MNSWEVYPLVLVQGDILGKKWCTPTTSHNKQQVLRRLTAARHLLSSLRDSCAKALTILIF